MFIKPEERIAVEPTREQKPLKLSEAIRNGVRILRKEGRGGWQHCALGAAFAGVHGRKMSDAENRDFVGKASSNNHTAELIGDAIGYPRLICVRVHEKHFEDGEPALEIADWLESQGY